MKRALAYGGCPEKDWPSRHNTQSSRKPAIDARRANAKKSEAMLHPCRNCHDIGQARRRVGLLPFVRSPADHGSIRLQTQSMIDACSDRVDAGQTCRYVGLPIIVSASGNDGAVRPEAD